MITFKDFVPEEGEQFDAIVERVNNWVHDNGVRVINLETVVLPNIERTSDTEIWQDPKDTYWYQFIRLWYDE